MKSQVLCIENYKHLFWYKELDEAELTSLNIDSLWIENTDCKTEKIWVS